MTTAAEKNTFTPEELLLLPDRKNYELVEGNLVERHMGSESSAIGAMVTALLLIFVKQHKAGHVYGSEGSYQCYADDPKKVRKPDVSFIRRGRLAEERVPTGHTKIAPDLVVEVISPGDVAYEVDEKVEEYLGAGVKLVWVVNPRNQTVLVYRPKGAALGTITAISQGDKISGEDVLPGFECAVSEFFQI